MKQTSDGLFQHPGLRRFLIKARLPLFIGICCAAQLLPLLLRHRVHVYFCGDDHTLQAPPRARPTTHGMIL